HEEPSTLATPKFTQHRVVIEPAAVKSEENRQKNEDETD
ncbi:unnamed protein product, partial [Rotaria socialis]